MGYSDSLMLREMPETEKPRERLMRFGAKALSNAELFAILINSGNRNESAVTLASRILSLEPRLSALSDYEAEEFIKLKGVGEAKACRIIAALEIGRRVACEPPPDRIDINNPGELAGLFMAEMKDLKKECFRIATLNSKMQYTGKYDISVGGVCSTHAIPREIFAPAIKKGAYGVVMVHNHPSGNPQPSESDLAVTKAAVAAGKILGIELMDHIIVSSGGFTSLRCNSPSLFG